MSLTTLFRSGYFVMHELIYFPVHWNVAFVLHRNLGSAEPGANLTLIPTEPGLHPCHASCLLAFTFERLGGLHRHCLEAQASSGAEWGHKGMYLVREYWVRLMKYVHADYRSWGSPLVTKEKRGRSKERWLHWVGRHRNSQGFWCLNHFSGSWAPKCLWGSEPS